MSSDHSARFIDDHFLPGAPPEMHFEDNDSFVCPSLPACEVLLADGRIVRADNPLASGAVGFFAGTWGFNGRASDDNVTFDGQYSITPAASSTVPEPGTGTLLGLGLIGWSLVRLRSISPPR
jgi:hypothetical protein